MLSQFKIASLPPLCFADAVCGPSAAIWAGWARRALLQESRLEAIVFAANELGKIKFAQQTYVLLQTMREQGPHGLNRSDLGTWIQSTLLLLDPLTLNESLNQLASSLKTNINSLSNVLIKELKSIIKLMHVNSLFNSRHIVARVRLPNLEYLPRNWDKSTIKNIINAIDSIKNLTSWLYTDFTRLIDCIVPTTLKRGRLVSATNSEMLGAIFITAHKDYQLIAEQIIHEVSHTRLFFIQMLNDLIEETILNDSWTNSKFYSPWRSDPRPLNGILHGAFVFDAVAEYWRQHLLFDSSNILARRRFGLITGQLYLAHKTLKHYAKFTIEGSAIFKKLENNLIQNYQPISLNLNLNNESVLDIESISFRKNKKLISDHLFQHKQKWYDDYANN
jgi:hypothetical protein